MDAAALLERAGRYTAEGLLRFGYVTRNDLSCREMRDAVATHRVYYPDRSYVGAVYDSRGDLIRSTLRFNHGDIFPVDTPKIDDVAVISARQSSDAVALYGGILFPILGHFLFESIARLWPLLWRRQARKASIAVYFHHWPGLELDAFMANPLYRETLNAFDLAQDDIKIIDHPIRFDTLIVPEPASAYHLNLDERMISILDRISKKSLGSDRGLPIRKERGRRIYLSRSHWQDNRRILNEDAIDALMATRGIEVVHTEAMQPRELMASLGDAGTVIAADGSHAHLAAFCRSGIRTIMLDTRPVPTQFAIAVLRRFRALHVPLFETPLYRAEQGITDLAMLGQVVDLALAS